MLGAVSYTPESGEEVDVLFDANGAFGFAMPAADTDVSATLVDTRVRYLDKDGKEQSAVAREITALTPVTTSLTGWYYVKEDVTVSNRIEAGEGFNLILCDGATLYAKKGIHVPAGSSLTIYSQSAGTGALTIDGLSMEYYNVGIGGNEYENAGTITIVGGRITAKGSYYGTSLVGGAGIGGGGRGGSGGYITISGGTVTANGGENAAGIGGGHSSKGGTIKITGGTVEATGSFSAGIGGGDQGAGGIIVNSGGNLALEGGSITGNVGTWAAWMPAWAP